MRISVGPIPSQALLERDVPQLGISIPSAALLRFWSMLAHVHGSVWNSVVPARSLGLSEPTVRRHLDLLTGLFMMKDGRRLGVDVKRADAPTLTPSMRIALEDLRLERLVVLYPGSISYQPSPRVSAVPLPELAGSGRGVLFQPPRRSGVAARNSKL